MKALEFTVLLFFIFLILCTLAREIKGLYFVVQRFPKFFQFIPGWSFFAPVPLMFDFEFWRRFVFSDGTIGAWQKVFTPQDRAFYSMVWNPSAKQLKTFVDLTIDLTKLCSMVEDKSKICTSVPYLSILNYINYIENDPKTSPLVHRVQFMVTRCSKLYDREVLFRSETHPIARS